MKYLLLLILLSGCGNDPKMKEIYLKTKEGRVCYDVHEPSDIKGRYCTEKVK